MTDGLCARRAHTRIAQLEISQRRAAFPDMTYSRLLLLLVLLLAACSREPRNAQPAQKPTSDASATPEREITKEPPATWFGVRFDNQRIALTVANTNAEPKLIVIEPPTRRSETALRVTD